jgi:hypothetical protein
MTKITRKYTIGNVDRFVKKLIKGKGDFLVRFGSECSEVVFDNHHSLYANKNKNFPNDMIFLFSLVQQDVKKFVKDMDYIELPPKVNVTEYNYNYDHNIGKLTGTDLNHAFWRIAYLKGYISEKTYEHGLIEKAKALRLATLSVLGREKKYEKYQNGVKIDDIIIRPKNEILQLVYKDIRYSCYYTMYELSKLLGDDFDCWKTDCIYYRDTFENRKKIHDFLDERNILYKQLV